MADITERIKNRKDKEEKEKKNNPSPLPETKQPQAEKEQPLPASGDKNTPDAMPAAPSQQQPTAPSQESRMVSEAPNAMEQPTTSLASAAAVPGAPPKLESNVAPDFVRMGYDEWAKQHPNTSRGEYAYALSNYRRKNGQPDLSYAEWQNIIKGNNPWETEADKKKRERREKAAFLIDGVGGLLGNIVNYVRAKNGHVAMPGFDVGKAYDRLNLLRQGQEKIANRNYQAYMDAIVRDRAEKAKKDAAAAALAAEQRKYQHAIDLEGLKQNSPYNKARIDTQAAQSEYYRTRTAGLQSDNEYKPKKQEAELKLLGARTNQANAAARRSAGTDKYVEIETPDGVMTYSPAKNGSNWIQEAYHEMLAISGKDKSPYKVNKLFGAGSEAPTDQEMYDAITRYNADQWKNQFRTGRYGEGNNAPPLD